MDAELKPTVASDIALPVRSRLVELKELQTTSGDPVRVLCERCDGLYVMQQFGMPGVQVQGEQNNEDRRRANAVRALEAAPHLVHVATALADADGKLVRPAFHCDDAHAVPGSFPWELLSLEDKLRVVVGILRLSGFGGAAEAEFSGSN